MSFGIDSAKVYANDGVANPAFWTLFPDHAHAKIVAALTADTAVQVAIQAKFSDPNNSDQRNFVIEHINRATVNCIGQHIVGRALQPEMADFTLYNLLISQTADAIDQVIGDPANTALHDGFAAQDANAVITVISRQTGRALLQTCISQAISTGTASLLSDAKAALLNAAKGIVPGVI